MADEHSSGRLIHNLTSLLQSLRYLNFHPQPSKELIADSAGQVEPGFGAERMCGVAALITALPGDEVHISDG